MIGSNIFVIIVSKIRTALNRCHSVLIVPDDDNKDIQPYHASLRDFLTSQGRSLAFFCAPAEFHAKILIACLKAITGGFRGNDKPHKYACIMWYHHCSSLLSWANASQDFQSLCHDVNIEGNKINLKWLKYWMVEALTWTGVGYIKVDLPLPVGMCTEAKTIHIKLEKIANILHDFFDFRPGYYRRVHDISPLLHELELTHW